MRQRPILVLIILTLAILIAGRFDWWLSVKGLVQSAVSPVLASETLATRKSIGFFSIITNLRNLAKENAQLREKVTQLEAELSVLKEIKHENDLLRAQLSFVQNEQEEFVPAQLIGRTTAGLIKDIVISRGTAQGIKTGSAVMAQGYLVGIVSEVSESQATVRLITHPGSLVPVVLQESRSTGLLRGGIGGLSMTDILIDATIAANETVVTSGLGGYLPSGLPVGKVVAITASVGDITKRSSVSSPIDPSKLELVFVRKAP